MTYPLRFPDADPRFTGELIDEIGAVLAAHGFPPVNDDTNFAGLREMLRVFLYGPAFDRGDKVSWLDGDTVRTGDINAVANAEDGPVARIVVYPQPGYTHRATVTAVVACRDLTLVPGGER